MRQPGDALPNQFPAVEPPGAARIALVGGAPSRDDDYHGSLLTGQPGAILDGALERCGLTRSQMFVGGVCQHHTADFSRLSWDGPQVQEGVRQLRADLEKFQPSIVVCLGQEALHLMKRGNTAPGRARGSFDWPDRIGDWRGSLFESVWPELGPVEARNSMSTRSAPVFKCLAAFHPSFVSKDYSQQAYYRCAPGIGDFERLRAEAGSSSLDLPVRHIAVLKREGLPGVAFEGVLKRLEKMRMEKLPVAVDIEGGTDGITSIAFSRNAETATVVPLARLSFARMWSKEDEGMIWTAIKALLEDPGILKIAHNAAYDGFCLEWAQGIRMQNVQDTMEQFWELFAELKKGLATLTSLLTRQPFYKPDKEEGEMKFSSDQEFWNYNGLDAVVTMECWERMWGLMGGRKAL